MTFIPSDDAERQRILTDLTTNFLVEAGAGSGKTTSLVGRMVQHVRTGTPVERLAAVTFTRKAANELRERFRNALETEIQAATQDAQTHGRFAQALHDLDRAFLGTIHGFCGRILREHPLEAGLDPTFQELSGEDMKSLERGFWRRWVDREERAGNADLQAVRAVGIDPSLLYEGFVCVRTYPDVRFDAADRTLPDHAPCRSMLEKLLDDAASLRPMNRPDAGWDPLMNLTRRLERSRSVEDWSTPTAFFRSIDSVKKSACKPTQNRWGATKEQKATAKALGEAFTALGEGEIATMVRAWREHRYALVMRVLQEAAKAFERERHSTGQLGFEDLLMLTARLLREHSDVRDELGARYAHLLVDEFQDTDPMQAEVCFLLASPSSEGNDWRAVRPRAGSLFVVGDPKQSIYRFRRADIGVYEFVKRRLTDTGAVLSLTSNFRSAHPIGVTVNAHFEGAFGKDATLEQAAFSPMLTMHEHKASGVCYYEIALPFGSGGNRAVIERDAALVASLIAERVEGGLAKPGDFLVLTRTKAPVSSYARALAAQNIPATTTGASLPQEHELRELMIVLRAIADPDNGIQVVAALEGLFFGLSPADLWDARQLGIRFAISHRPSEVVHKVAAALLQLHEWWIMSQRQPVDVLLERILDDTGLLYHATSQTLGDARAGALLHIVETLRAASTAGGGGVPDAIERLESLRQESLDDITLRPGRTDAVRIMNVHQAKGLEAPIVILAAPVDKAEFEPRVHIQRADSGDATGGLCLGYKDGQQFVTLAQCVGWDEMQVAESAFEAAEEARLLYVAATRAERELIVARYEEIQKSKNKPDNSIWRPLAAALDATGVQIQIEPRAGGTRRIVDRTTESIQLAAVQAKQSVESARKATFTVQTVTQSAKSTDNDEPYVLRNTGGGKGAAWGRAVHRVIESYVRGRRDARLGAFAVAVANDERLSPALHQELQTLATELHGTELSTRLNGNGSPLAELSVMRYAPHEGVSVLTEGVIDVAVLRDGAWEVIDWKTDTVDQEEWTRRRKQYERQVEAYGSILTELTGHSATVSVQRVH